MPELPLGSATDPSFQLVAWVPRGQLEALYRKGIAAAAAAAGRFSVAASAIAAAAEAAER